MVRVLKNTQFQCADQKLVKDLVNYQVKGADVDASNRYINFNNLLSYVRIMTKYKNKYENSNDDFINMSLDSTDNIANTNDYSRRNIVALRFKLVLWYNIEYCIYLRTVRKWHSLTEITNIND